MKQKSRLNMPEKYLSKTQEVLYQKEFRSADRMYKQFSQKENRS